MTRTTSASPIIAKNHPWLRLLIIALASLLALGPLSGIGLAVVERSSAVTSSEAASWTMTPTGWTNTRIVCATVTDSDGLQEITAEYRYSTNSGSSWTDWSSDVALEHSSPIATMVYLTATIPALIESGTANKVQFRLQDNNFVTEESPIHTVVVDSLPPTSPSNLVVNPSGWSSVNAFDLTWTNPVQTGSPIYRAYYKFGNAPSDANDYSGYREGINIWRIDDLAAPTGGAVPCHIWIADAAGNADYTTAQNVTLYFSGGSAPEPPFAMQILPSGWVSTCVFTATWSNPSSSTSGIAAAWYKWGSAPTSSDDGTRVAGDDIEILTDLTPPGQGQYDLHVWLEDGAGSKDHNNRNTKQALCDTTLPTTAYNYNPPLPAAGWYSNTVTVNLNAQDQDGLSGIKETRWQRGGGLWNIGASFTAESYQPYHFYSVDNAGNVEATQTITPPIDLTAPVSAISVSPAAPAGGWYSQTVTVTIGATDDLSGWASESWYRVGGSGAFSSGVTATIATSGVHMFEYYSRDRAGNIEATRMVTPVCRIDLTPPTASATPSATGAYVQPPVVITFTANDLHSGVKTIEYRAKGSGTWISSPTTATTTVWGSEGDKAYTFEYRAHDQVGNVSNIQEISVNVDGTPPLPPTGLSATPSGWANQNGGFGLTWTNPSDFSGIAGVYYQLDVTPTITLSPTYVAGTGINSLANRAVSGEGQHSIYIWLQDGAGNNERYHYQVLPNAFKYDATPPQCDTLGKQGTLGNNGFYTSPVTVTLASHDSLSGLAAYHYRINEGSWITVPVSSALLTFSQDGRYIINHRASDLAGNTQSVPCQETIWVDATAPASPVSPIVTPSDWTRTNSFSVNWTNPVDSPAGIAAAYLKRGAAPSSNRDGQRYESGGITNITGLTVDAEGETPIYVWLEDRAGNINYANRVAVSLKYDRTAPSTTLVKTGVLGNNGYYVSPVTLRFDAVDAASGVAAIYYRLNGGAEQVWDGSNILLNQEGEYTVTFRATDRAGNSEQPAKQEVIKLDLIAPRGDLRVPSQYTASSSTAVEWSGSDSSQGSGVEKYTVEYRIGGCSPWQVWLSNTAATSSTFSDLWANRFYYFRVRATDYAGNVSIWTEPDADDFIYREGLSNPSFDSCSLTPWVAGGVMPESTIYTDTRGCVALLGSILPVDVSMPKNGYSSLSQSVTLPLLDCDYGLQMAFSYRIFSYDVAWGKDVDDGMFKWFDTFEVYVRDGNGQELANFMLPGNRLDYASWVEGQLYDSAWRDYAIDLTPWAGQTVWLDFRVWNRVDEDWPTWAMVDNIRLIPISGESLFIPLVSKDGLAAASPTALLEAPGVETRTTSGAYGRKSRK